MDTPMQSTSVSLIDALGRIRPEVRNLENCRNQNMDPAATRLNLNESPFDIPITLKEDILRDLRFIPWSRYPNRNPQELRMPLARALGVDKDQLLVAGGSNPLIGTVMGSVLSPGDRMILCPPVFSFYENTSRIYKPKLMRIPLLSDFSVDAEALLKGASLAHLIVLCSPNNPTGSVISLDLLKKVLTHTPGLVLWDEAYAEFWGQSAVALLSQFPRLLVLRTFSKALGLAGLRVGYLVGHPALIREIQKIAVPYDMNCLSLLAAMRVLDAFQWVETRIRQIVNERESLYRKMKAISGVEPFPSQANFICFQVPDARRLDLELRRRGILIRPLNEYPELKNMLRVTVGTPDENRLFLRALREIMKEMRP